MTQEQTTQNNKLIAEFMGVRHKDDEKYISDLKEMRKEGIFFEQGYMTSELKYHTSWDWLMPVVKKCLNSEEKTEGQHYFINDSLLTCNIEVVYDRVVEFIKDFNS